MQFQPVVPLEPVRVEKLPEGSQWVAQVKWDGVRILTYYDGRNVQLFNRKLNERTMQFPEFVDLSRYCSAESVILDGEIIALHHGKPSFHEVMKRDGIRRWERVNGARRNTPVVYMIFDVLYCNSEWVTDKPLHRRQQLLNEIITPQDDVQLVENFPNAESLFRVIKAEKMEGIVCKDLNSTYGINEKDSRWQKLKNYRDLIAVVGGVTLKSNIVNALLLGLYDHQGQLWYIGHAGTGKLAVSEWKSLTERVKHLIISQTPFVNKVERMSTAVWVKPLMTVKIKFLEWTEGCSLRQPSIQAFVEVPPEGCLFE